MTKLSKEAENALETLRQKHVAYTVGKATVESELKKELQARLSAIRNERDIALLLAAEAGVPKTQLGKAIGTSNYRTVQEILAEVDGISKPVVSESSGSVQIEKVNGNEYRITIVGVGEQKVSGSAVVNSQMDFVDGDHFVVPQIYRNGFADQIASEIERLG